jgi:NADPH:quinone reductase-like Zn-dependent oxidoreductase
LKAVYFYDHGETDVLQYGEVETPLPGPGQVQVELKAAALNRMDVFTRKGWPGLKLEYPHITGADGAGIISAIGEGVTNIEIGHRVVIDPNIGCGECEMCLSGKDNLCRHWHLLGETIPGTYARYVVVPSQNVFPLPQDFPYRGAAAAGLVFLTAWHSLITRGGLKGGESVLIIGASGGVNTASIQLAKHFGAEVYVVGSGREKLELAESLGADYLIDRSEEDNWSKAVYLATQKRGVDVVVDNVGAATMHFSLRAARKGGRILTVGNTSGPKFEIDNRFIFGKHLSILGSTMGTLEEFNQVMNLVFEGKLTPVLDKEYPLKDAAKAQQRLEAGEQMGKITLAI